MDSILLTVPVSSPLHPQAILPCLEAYLKYRGFSVKSIDSNIDFFWYLIGAGYDVSDLKKFNDDPVRVLNFYNRLEETLTERSKAYRGCKVALRSLKLAYDRTSFGEVRKALFDEGANPFIAYYRQLIEKRIKPDAPRITGISVTFQDQIIPAFTLARLVREMVPGTRIVLGGQMITRCHDTLIDSAELKEFWDYLVLWEGEVPLADLHEALINGRRTDFINIIENGKEASRIERAEKALPVQDWPAPDFSNIELDRYIFSDMLIPLQTSRGCFGTCEFCAIPFGANQQFRSKSGSQLLEHILNVKEQVSRRYGRDAVYFKFMDDTPSPKVLLEVSREIEARKLDVKWEAFARLDTFYADDGVMAQLYRGGCRKLCWGLESSDPGILKNMNKNNTNTQSTRILNSSAKAGVQNFCFVLVGFPGETDEQRRSMTEYIVNNPDIHVLTIATFDFTKYSPMQRGYRYPNQYGLYSEKARGFEVRLPYLLDGFQNWKEMIVEAAHEMLLKIIGDRPDIGFVSLYPDQIRMVYCEKYGNDWGKAFLKKYGEANITAFLSATGDFLEAFRQGRQLDFSVLPEPLQREKHREMEDLLAIRAAIGRRREYEQRRIDQV